MDVNAFLAHRRPVATKSGEIACTEFGDGPAALFVHGLGKSSVLWRQVIEELSGSSRCIAPDWPAHGASPARDDMSLTAVAEGLADLCDSLGLDQVDLVGNDTGGAIALILAARHPGKIRTLTLTNGECEGNFPPPDFVPFVELAKQGGLAPMAVELAANPETLSSNPLVSAGYQDPQKIPQEAWSDYFTGVAGTPERARDFERLVASLDAADLTAVGDQLRALQVPTLVVWGTAEANFPVRWAYHLRDMIPGTREVIEIDGADMLFAEERPEDLIPHLHRHWGR
jgi:pimeloyl-ACP methyl ester carboxylesterase